MKSVGEEGTRSPANKDKDLSPEERDALQADSNRQPLPESIRHNILAIIGDDCSP